VNIIRPPFVPSWLRVRFPVSGYVQAFMIPQRLRMWKPEGAPGMASHEATKPRRGIDSLAMAKIHSLGSSWRGMTVVNLGPSLDSLAGISGG